jgi:hypothetical protein
MLAFIALMTSGRCSMEKAPEIAAIVIEFVCDIRWPRKANGEMLVPAPSTLQEWQTVAGALSDIQVGELLLRNARLAAAASRHEILGAHVGLQRDGCSTNGYNFDSTCIRALQQTLVLKIKATSAAGGTAEVKHREQEGSFTQLHAAMSTVREFIDRAEDGEKMHHIDAINSCAISTETTDSASTERKTVQIEEAAKEKQVTYLLGDELYQKLPKDGSPRVLAGVKAVSSTSIEFTLRVFARPPEDVAAEASPPAVPPTRAARPRAAATPVDPPAADADADARDKLLRFNAVSAYKKLMGDWRVK